MDLGKGRGYMGWLFLQGLLPRCKVSVSIHEDMVVKDKCNTYRNNHKKDAVSGIKY